MIKQVARALAIADGMEGIPDEDLERCGYCTLAQAALEALRKPSDAMILTGIMTAANYTTELVWQAMVNQALKEE